MKNFKQFVIVLLVLAMAASLALCAFACQEKLIDAKGTAVIVVASAEEGGTPTSYTVDLSKVKGNEGLITVLDYLKANEGLTYAATKSETGAFLDSVNGIKNDNAKSEYIFIYSTVTADFDTSGYASTTQYNGLTLTSVGVSASAMHIKDGSTIYIGIIKW